jgi:hypothetical protein
MDKKALVIEKFEYRGGINHFLLRISSDGVEIRFPLNRGDGPDGFLRRDGRWTGIAGDLPTAVEALAKIRSNLEAKAQHFA